MPRGSVSQVLKVAKLPDGMTMTITDVRFTIPGGNNSWWPTFAGVTKNTSAEDKKKVFPFEVSPTINYGRVGEVGLTSLSVFDSGEGPTACIDFTLGGDFFAKAAISEQKGTINVSTSEWGGWTSFWGNANQIVLAYNFAGLPSVPKIIDIPASGHTQELLMMLALEASGERLQMNWAVEKNWAFDAANFLVGGVYFVHEKTYEWAFSAVGGWPAVAGAVAGAEMKKKLFD